ncbi:MAG: CheY-like chemotaxis protein [Candidatus Pelagisphaera sp.]|jgi:CheY-like chemotaxis protein
MVARRMLTSAGHQVMLAFTGEEAVKTWEQNTFDIILMDVSMPLMDGYEATRRIRAIETERNATTLIPIFAVTALTNSQEKQNSIAAGMNGFITKPFNRDLLMKTIESIYSVPQR